MNLNILLLTYLHKGTLPPFLSFLPSLFFPHFVYLQYSLCCIINRSNELHSEAQPFCCLCATLRCMGFYFCFATFTFSLLKTVWIQQIAILR